MRSSPRRFATLGLFGLSLTAASVGVAGRRRPSAEMMDQLGIRALRPVRTYQLWADALRPSLTELPGPRAATDQAPPPTGDPNVRGA